MGILCLYLLNIAYIVTFFTLGQDALFGRVGHEKRYGHLAYNQANGAC